MFYNDGSKIKSMRMKNRRRDYETHFSTTSSCFRANSKEIPRGADRIGRHAVLGVSREKAMSSFVVVCGLECRNTGIIYRIKNMLCS